MDVSAFMVVKDAEHLLPSAISNLRRFADEVIVIVDDETVDGTWRVANDFADRVERWVVGGSYESVLNEAAALCSHRWTIYSHDDELWTPAFRYSLPLIMAGYSEEVTFPRRHIMTNGREWITSEPWWPDYQVRLRTKGAWGRSPWPREVHSSPTAVSREYSAVPIWHMKFVVKSDESRSSRLARWGTMMPDALSDHYRKFSLPNGYKFDLAPVTEVPPEELESMLEAIRWQIR